MKHEIICIATLLLLVTSLTVVANETIDIIAGDTTEVDFTINNENNKEVTCYLNTSILPNGTGINVTYSTGDTFKLSKHETIIVTMFVKTDMLLMPQNYTIQTSISFEEAEDTGGSSGKSRGRTIYWSGTTPSTPQENETEEPDPPQEPTPPENNVSEMPDVRAEIVQDDGALVLYAALALMLMATIVAIYLYLKITKKKEEDENKEE